MAWRHHRILAARQTRTHHSLLTLPLSTPRPHNAGFFIYPHHPLRIYVYLPYNVYMREPQRCSRCQTLTSNVIIHARRTLKDGTEAVYWYCNPCNASVVRKRYKTHTASFKEMVYKSIKKHQAKQNARARLNKAVRDGAITRPTNCEDCKKKCKPHGHHEDYTKPLEVNWLCTTCHANRHQEHRAHVGSVATM